jgi:hypothetical protein
MAKTSTPKSTLQTYVIHEDRQSRQDKTTQRDPTLLLLGFGVNREDKKSKSYKRALCVLKI